MAQSMKLSQRSAATGRRCDAFVPASPAVRAPMACAAFRHTAPSSMAPVAALSVASSSRDVASKAVAAAPAPTSAGTTTKQWFALVASSEFFFNDVQNESIAEQLRERVRFFKENNKEHDFWLVPDPKWLDAKFPNEAKQVTRPCVALVSTDEMWIVFMKLRLDRVLKINLGTVSQEEALAVGGKVPEFKKPAKWTAVYAPYTAGWWNVFLPK